MEPDKQTPAAAQVPPVAEIGKPVVDAEVAAPVTPAQASPAATPPSSAPSASAAATPVAPLVAPDPSLDPLAGKVGGPGPNGSKANRLPVATTVLPAVFLGLLVVVLVLAVLAYAFLG